MPESPINATVQIEWEKDGSCSICCTFYNPDDDMGPFDGYCIMGWCHKDGKPNKEECPGPGIKKLVQKSHPQD